MHAQKRYMLVFIFLIQSEAEDGAFIQDIRALRFFAYKLHDCCVLVRLGHGRDIDEFRSPVLPIADDCNWHAIAFNKARAKGLVPPKDNSERFFKSGAD